MREKNTYVSLSVCFSETIWIYLLNSFKMFTVLICLTIFLLGYYSVPSAAKRGHCTGKSSERAVRICQICVHEKWPSTDEGINLNLNRKCYLLLISGIELLICVDHLMSARILAFFRLFEWAFFLIKLCELRFFTLYDAYIPCKVFRIPYIWEMRNYVFSQDIYEK